MTSSVADWGFAVGSSSELLIGGVSAEWLAHVHGTPLHVIDEVGLERRARRIAAAFLEAYPGKSRVHFAMKCNDTPGVVQLVIGAGLSVEVGTPYEWWLAREMGVAPMDIVVNGPWKGPLLEVACREGAGLIVLDGLDEIETATTVAAQTGSEPRVLLRVNPDFVPRGMNRATATGSRRRSMFGLDLAGGEVDEALARLGHGGPLRYVGLHCHVGSGIADPRDYRVPVNRLMKCAALAARLGMRTEVLDVGGGIGVPTSRELTTREYLTYHALGRLPSPCIASAFPPIEAFAASIAGAITSACDRHSLELPTLIAEPGRAVVSSAGVLLVTIRRIKQRRGVGTWAIADGGAGTVAFPLFYELHDILHCRAPEAAHTHRYDLVGSACFSADWLYRRKPLPELRTGDVLAVCDAGAYFTVQESNFGFTHPPIVAVRDGQARLLRRRESLPEMVARDVMPATVARTSAAQVTRPSLAARGNDDALRFRRLGPTDADEAIALFGRGFDGHDLYGPVLGLDRTSFREYFTTLVPLALTDETAVVLGAERRGRLAAVLIAARPEFPTLRGGLRHIRAFARAAGWVGVVKYLRFIHGSHRFMSRPAAELKQEFRGLWLASDPGMHGGAAGGFLVRAACDYSRRMGYPIQTAIVDSRTRRLVSFYERHGFHVVPASAFLDGQVALMEHRFPEDPSAATAL